jgi:tripartite-type tricarboxylate transporter receptor subunit TctC
VPHIKAGKITALLVTSEKRLSGLPDVPSFVEEGLPGSDTWYGIAGPGGMPAPLIEKINGDVRQALKAEAVQKRLSAEYFQALDLDAERSTRYVRSDFDRWGPLVQAISASISR